MCKIEFEIPNAGHVTVKVVDIIGAPVTTLINSHKEPGKHTVNFSEEKLPPGKYYYKIFLSDSEDTDEETTGPISSGLIKIKS